MFDSGKKETELLAEIAEKIVSGDLNMQVPQKLTGRGDGIGRLAAAIEQIRTKAAEDAAAENEEKEKIRTELLNSLWKVMFSTQLMNISEQDFPQMVRLF